MELRDLVVTPLVVVLIFWIAFMVRPLFTDAITRRYFFPALCLRLFGALALGFLYQYYYEGGDTYNFHTHGSRHIWRAFMDDPLIGWKLLTAQGEYGPGLYQYARDIWFYTDPDSYFVIRVAALFDLFTFSSYSATACLFAVLSFSGAWALFLTFYHIRPDLHRLIALATLFIPSVIFWGSGLLKDTLTLAALGMLTFSIHELFGQKRMSIRNVLLLVVSAWVIFSVKKYILMSFAPAVILWLYLDQLMRIRSHMLRLMLIPIILAGIVASGYYALVLVGADDPQYSLDRIAITAQITAHDIGFYTGRDAGSTYSLGELDGTFTGMISKAPQAIVVSLFRPWLWEVKNPLMMLSALESFLFLIITLRVVLGKPLLMWRALSSPVVVFCLVFSLIFAFAVGVSTFNFGTLARYKIPLLPFYSLALIFTFHQEKRERNREVLEETE
jgi:hypothetical protein